MGDRIFQTLINFYGKPSELDVKIEFSSNFQLSFLLAIRS